MRVSISAVLLLALSSTGFPKPASAQDKASDPEISQESIVRRDVDLVSIYFTVRDDKKRLANDLPQDNFSVSEDGRPQALKFFAHHSDVLLSVGVLLDTGTNMSWILNEEAQASALFVRHVIRPTDLGFILSYASRVETVQLPTSDVALLEEQAHSIQIGGAAIGLPNQSAPSRGVSFPGGTVGINGKPINKNREAHLYDAVRVSALRYLSGEVGRKAVVIVALSGDSQSESTMEDALEALLANDVIAYVLQIYDAPGRDHCDVLHIFEKDSLKKLAEATGGRMLEVRGMEKLGPALDEISDELHHQYSLGYYPQNKNWDGSFRKIQISATQKGYKIYARRGYYANRPTPSPAPAQ
ncbi:MAG TPA: VWA domain-containing protein [Candidatus Methylomirabilis sp.]|nr:VWA domain-containing protein [Candidatus Methylomirabilis sp.]